MLRTTRLTRAQNSLAAAARIAAAGGIVCLWSVAGCSSDDFIGRPGPDAGEGSRLLARDFSGDTIVVRYDDVWLKTRSARVADLDADEKCHVAKNEVIQLDRSASQPRGDDARPGDVLIRLKAAESRRLCPDFDGRPSWYVFAESFRDGSGSEPGEDFRIGRQFWPRGTGYYPAPTGTQGGTVDRRGRPLKTLQKFLSGNAAYVSVAMDVNAFPYGSVVHSKELDAKYKTKLRQLGKKHIEFCVVDTGGAFRGTGTSRIDVCTANSAAAHDSTINSRMSMYQVLKLNGRPKMCL